MLLLRDSWGQGWRGRSQWKLLLLGWRCHTAKAPCRAGQGVANMTPLISGVFKGQGQNKPWRKSHQQWETPGLSWVGSRGS